MRRELGIQCVAGGQSPARAGEVRNIRVDLPCKNRIAFMTQLLRVLDLGIPICALDQPHRDPTPGALCQGFQVVEYITRTSLVGLDRETEAVIAVETRVRKHALENLQRQLEAICFLGIDRQRDVRSLRVLCEFEQPCLLYTSPSPRDQRGSRMPSSA